LNLHAKTCWLYMKNLTYFKLRLHHCDTICWIASLTSVNVSSFNLLYFVFSPWRWPRELPKHVRVFVYKSYFTYVNFVGIPIMYKICFYILLILSFLMDLSTAVFFLVAADQVVWSVLVLGSFLVILFFFNSLVDFEC